MCSSDLNWFYEQPAVKRLLALLENGKMKITPLGFGFDAISGEPNVAFLVMIDDEKFWEEEKKEIVFNWEVESIVEIDLKDERLENMLKESDCHNGSLFAISEAIEYLKKV